MTEDEEIASAAQSDTARTGILFTDEASGLLRARRYRIEVLSGPDAGRTARFEGGTFLIGTHQNTDLRLTDKGVSRYHVELQLRTDGLKVTDLDSTNGTFHGETRLGAVVLASKAKARLRLGPNTEIELEPDDITVGTPAYERERFGQALSNSRVMQDLFALLERVSLSDATLLIEGEAGTGKELLAEAVHLNSARRERAFVVVDCGSLPRDLIADELFGHIAGGVPGTTRDKQGLLEQADGGTLFFNEVAALPQELQPQLLRAIEKREVRRLGEVRPRKVDIRVIAASDRPLRNEVRAGKFREDLFFRLAVVRAHVPPLRDRKDDIPMLVRHFMAELHQEFDLSSSVLSLLMAHEWPGNVRELRTLVERGLRLEGSELGVEDIGERTGDGSVSGLLLDPSGAVTSLGGGDADVMQRPFKEAKGLLVESFEREYLTHLLARHNGNISRAAHEAGIDRNYIHRLVKKYNLSVDRG